jgi:cAMP-dependent protein kinase regulator
MLDHALNALAHDDALKALCCSIPAMDDPDTQAAAVELTARALHTLGESSLASRGFSLAIPLLAERGLVPHAIAAAITLREINGNDAAEKMLAAQFGAQAKASGAVRPPALSQHVVKELPSDMGKSALISQAKKSFDALPVAGTVPNAKFALWSALPTDAFVRFVKTLQVRLLAQGAVLVREGDVGESAFLLARGELSVMRGSEELAVLGVGAIVGEMALVTEAPRTATLVAAHAVLVLEAPRNALNDAAREVPAVGEQIVAFFHRRLVDNVVRTSALLRELPAAERDGLAQLFETRSFESNQVLIAEGDETPGLYLIAVGTLAVSRRDGKDSLRLATLGPGSCVGEIGLVLRRPATASVIAESAGIALCLPGKRFMEVVKGRPTLLAKLYELAVSREDETRSVLGVAAEEVEDFLL